MRFECPSCKSVRSANERLLGRKIKCPECGQLVQVPTAEEMARQELERERKAKVEAQRKAVQAARLQPTIVQAYEVADGDQSDLSDEERMAAEERDLAAARTTFTRPRPANSEDMDMTPMVDVTFLLLIFFMITASFSVQKSIQRPAQRKEDPSINAVENPDEDNPDIVTVQVDEFNAYNVITTDWDRVAGNKQDLIVALGDAHAGDASGDQPTKLIVQAHEDCIHRAVIDALDAGREALFESFEVSTVEQFD